MQRYKYLSIILILILLLLVLSSCGKKTSEPDVKTVATPTFELVSGAYASASISCATNGATIRYTTDGNDPTQDSAVYSSPISLSSHFTIKAIGYREGWNPSPISSATYTFIPVAAPTFNPLGGEYGRAQFVSISCATTGATIRYTADGSDPDFSSTAYSSPILVSSTTTLKAKGFKNNCVPSATSSETYTIGFTPVQMVHVPGGTFNNGSSDVTVSSFYLDKHQLTQAGYEAVMGINPSFFGGNPNHPVEQISWLNTIEYCNRRSLQEGLTPCYSYSYYGTNPANWPSGWNTSPGKHIYVGCNWAATGYRLPTEMEWMFAARGGDQTHNYIYSGSNNLDDVGWYDNNIDSYGTRPVGTKAANELGLYDLSGNVRERVWDIHGDYPSGSQNDPVGSSSGSSRVMRGGSWFDKADYCTVSFRGYGYADVGSHFMGFRVCKISP